MNTLRTKILRGATIAAAFSVLTAIVSANETNSKPADPLGVALQVAGSLPVKAAGPYVQVGSFRIWVSAHLGRPKYTLPDGSWAYDRYNVDDSDVEGTLVVTFDHGRVSQLRLVSPAVFAALRTAPKSTLEGVQVATAK